MAAADTLVETPAIEARINYLAPGSFINRRFVAPRREMNTGEYLPHMVEIRDARPHQTEFTLRSHGFTLIRHPSGVRNFLDKDEVNASLPRWRRRSRTSNRIQTTARKEQKGEWHK